MVKIYSNFLIIEGADCAGKNSFLNTIIDYEINVHKTRILNLPKYWKEKHFHPQFTQPDKADYIDINSFDIIISAEPTNCGIGKIIREEVIGDNKREYSALATAHLYALDRLILFKRVIIPALEAGKIVLQSRSVPSSMVYQPCQAKFFGKEVLELKKVLELEGNKFVLDNLFGHMIILKISDEEMERRLNKKENKDAFERYDFQKIIQSEYLKKDWRKILEYKGCLIDEFLNEGDVVVDINKLWVKKKLHHFDLSIIGKK